MAARQVGLARLPNGTLNVIWDRGRADHVSIYDTRIAPGGRTAGTTVVARNWYGGDGLAAVALPDGRLRVFATGAQAMQGRPSRIGVHVFTGRADGTHWTLDQGDVWGGAAATRGALGATLTHTWVPVTAWAGTGVALDKVGTGRKAAGTERVCPCAATSASLVTSTRSGAVVIWGRTVGRPSGTYVQQALPTIGVRQVLPSATQTAGDSGAAARVGAPGVYVAYTDEGRAGVRNPSVRLAQYGGTSTTVATGPFTIAKAFAAPDGRLWVVWGDTHRGIYVERSNRAVTAFEPVQRLSVPRGTVRLWNAQGEGSAGPLDLFIEAGGAHGARDFWGTHVLPRFNLTAKVSPHALNTTTPVDVELKATDAGDLVPGVRIAVDGQHVITGPDGVAMVEVHQGGYEAHAQLDGYTPSIARFDVH